MVDNCPIFFRQRAIYTVYTFLFIRTDVIQVLMRFIEIFFSRPLSSTYQFIDHCKNHEISTFSSTRNNFQSSLIHQHVLSLFLLRFWQDEFNAKTSRRETQSLSLRNNVGYHY